MIVELCKGGKTIVDDDFRLEFPDMKLYYAQVSPRKGYVRVSVAHRSMYLHRLLTGCPRGLEVDHINGDPLDNRMSNLRVCTKAENRRNLGLSKRNTSGYKGVYWSPGRQRWHVRVGSKHIGRYRLLKEAVSAYNEAAISTYGAFAKINK